MMTNAVLKNYEDVQKKSSCGNGYEAVIAKDVGEDGGNHGPPHPSETGAFPGYEDTDDQDEAEKRMRKSRPDLNTRQAIQLAIGSYRHRAEVHEKTMRALRGE